MHCRCHIRFQADEISEEYSLDACPGALTVTSVTPPKTIPCDTRDHLERASRMALFIFVGTSGNTVDSKNFYSWHCRC
jgi:hypothetical protein